MYKMLVAVFIAVVFKLLFFRLSEVINIDILAIAVVILVLWEGNIKINKLLNSKINWIDKPRKRLLWQALAFTLFTSITLFLLMYTMHRIKTGDGRLLNPKMQEIFLPALFLAIAIITLYISYQFFMAWKESLLEVEKYKAESSNAQLQNLRNQVNPHFLFNNLSVLSSLVYQNQDKAVEFIQELSKVYRYVLDNKNIELTSLPEEFEFLEHYFYLLKIRFGDNISFETKIDTACNNKLLPPMCLQTLAENTFQHNEISSNKPLKVQIYTEENCLIMENPIQLRSDSPTSSKMGLKNIAIRYQFFTSRKMEVIEKNQTFKVILPLID
jgi:sensor histidine kinase YesM